MTGTTSSLSQPLGHLSHLVIVLTSRGIGGEACFGWLPAASAAGFSLTRCSLPYLPANRDIHRAFQHHNFHGGELLSTVFMADPLPVGICLQHARAY